MGLIATIKAVKDIVLIFIRDTVPVVYHRKSNILFGGDYFYLYQRIILGMLNGIIHKDVYKRQLQDLYGRVGVVQIHPVFEELLHAFDTRPPVQRNEVE